MSGQMRRMIGAGIVVGLLSSSSAPASDHCATATPISGNGTFPFNLVGATFSPEGQDQCADEGVAFENDVWFCWTATCTGLIQISTCGQTNVDTKIAFYINGCACPTPPPSQPPLCCSDDAGQACGVQTMLSCEVQCGRQYLIRLGTKPGNPPGSGTFTINCEGNACDQCDDCCGRRPNFITNAGFGGGVAVMTQESGVNTRVVDFVDIAAPQPPVGSNINWNAPFYSPTGVQDWTHANLGSVFGVTLDHLGNVYVTHTSAYSAWFASGDAIGGIAGGAAGAIYRIDTNTGVPSVFAVLPNAAIASCAGTECWPGLGNICYSCVHDSFYVSNHEDGRIYRLDPSGAVQQTWKHATGTIMNGGGVDPNDTNGFAPLAPHSSTLRGQRVWAVQVNRGRLYYSVWREDSGRPDAARSNEIWSVGLFPGGGFIAGSEQLELLLPVLANGFSNPVSDISFRPQSCCMLLAERSMLDDTTSWAHDSRLLEYCRVGNAWSPSGNTFQMGSTLVNSSAGGCDYDFDTSAGINVNVWGTGDAIKLWDVPTGTDPAIYGLGGMTFSGTNPYSNGLMIDSNQDTLNGNKFMQGEVEITCPEPNPPICEPRPDGAGCRPVVCEGPVIRECQPRCILIGHDGAPRVSECDCLRVDQCHAVFVPGAPVPQCEGICPPGKVCIQRVNATADGTEYCCECVDDPPECVPTSDGQGCVPFVCDDPAAEACKPRCVRMDSHGGFTVLNCDCRGQDECHVVFGQGTTPFCEGACPPGTTCVQNIVRNEDGSFDVCCDCIDQHCDCPGDVNGDGVLNGADIAGFVRCFLGQPQAQDNCACADIDANGIYDHNDVTFFVERVLNKAECNETPCCPKADLILDLTTGVDDNNNLIPIGNDDDQWIVTCEPQPVGTLPRPATVIPTHSAWAVTPGSQWISAAATGPNGTYCYDFCFCLDSRYRNATVTLQVRSDDAAQVFLNGNFIGNASGYNDPNPATITTSNPAFFQPGENCIQIISQNLGGVVTGINMTGRVTAIDGKCCCPPRDLNKDIDTGVYDNGGGLIPISMDDDTWTVTCEPAPGGTLPRPATVISPHPAWLTIPGTQWISASQYGPDGWYCYEYCFCLDPRFENPVLDLDLRADDYAEVWLNGSLVGQTSNGWAFNTPQPFNIFVTNPSLFVACENCIEIRVLNGGGVVTGFNASGSITAENGLCCDDPPLSCCMQDGTCVDLAPGQQGCPFGGTLIDGPCETPRGCCLPDGACRELEPRCCEAAGGTVLPAGMACGTQVQACCIPGGVAGGAMCVDMDPACCAMSGGTAQGPGTACQGDGNGNGIDDACEETQDCHVNPATGYCAPTACPVPGEECLPRCALIDSATGQFIQIYDCDCRNVFECHMELTPAPIMPICVDGNCPPGTQCRRTMTDLGNGTTKVCCECVPVAPVCEPIPGAVGCSPNACTSPDEVCSPKCVQMSGGVVVGVAGCDCRSPDECHVVWDDAMMNPQCVGVCPPGTTCTAVATVNPDGTEGLCCVCEPSPPVCEPIPGAVGCSPNACTSPDEVCSPKCVQMSGGVVVGVAGCDCRSPDECHVVWDAAMMNPQCVGVCPPGTTCTAVATVNPDGTQSLCCVCEPTTTAVCPLSPDVGGQLCQSHQQAECASPVPTTSQCRPRVIQTNGPGQPVTVLECTCFDPGVCGAISIEQLAQGNYFLTCNGPCLPQSGWTCNVHIDGMPIGQSGINSANVPPGSIVTCRCAP